MSWYFIVIHVAVGVVFNKSGQILIAKRPPHKTKSGLWEFPGGKLESGETVFEALARELQEEVGLTIQAADPFLVVNYRNEEHEVILDTWTVNAWTGDARGCEGQAIKWVDVQALRDHTFPEGNRLIIDRLCS